MNAGGYQMPGGSGNGAPPRLNPVTATALWRECRRKIEEQYPWLPTYGFFRGVEALMIVLDVEEDARFLSGDTWLVTSPDDYFPVVSIYFTYVAGHITLQAVHAE